MRPTLDYYFAPISPWTYLGQPRFQQMVRDSGAVVRLRPMDLGQVFPASGGLPLPQRAPQRQAYRLVELQRYSQWLGLPLNLHPAHFPAPGALASQLVLAADDAAGTDAALDLLTRLGAAVWAQERHIGDPAHLAQVLAEAGLAAELLERAQAPDLVERHAECTRQALAAGVFGAPCWVIDGELFWGQDRLDFVARRLGLPG